MMTGEDLRKYLEFNNVDCTGYSDEDLEYLMEMKMEEIQSLTGVPIYPTEHLHVNRRFHDDFVLLPYYPLSSIDSLQINGEDVQENEYYTVDETGILYFQSIKSGVLRVEFTVQLSDQTIASLIQPLLKDMVVYDLTKSPSTDASSVKEGDVSITYDTGLSLGASIQKQLDSLRNYTIRVKWL